MAEFLNLGLLLKNKRIQKKFTQAELASALDMHSQYVSNWERGLCAPPADRFHRLIELLKIKRVHVVEAMLADAKNEIREKVYQKRKTRKIDETSL